MPGARLLYAYSALYSSFVCLSPAELLTANEKSIKCNKKVPDTFTSVRSIYTFKP